MLSTGKACVLLGVFATLGLGVPVQAHHSGAAYDGTKTVRIEGTVESWRFANPHCSLQIRAGDGDTLWSFEGNPAGMMMALGYRRDTFAPEAHVVVVYNPMKDGQPGGGRIVGAILDGGKTVGNIPAP
jgi:hypothetical protein